MKLPTPYLKHTASNNARQTIATKLGAIAKHTEIENKVTKPNLAIF